MEHKTLVKYTTIVNGVVVESKSGYVNTKTTAPLVNLVDKLAKKYGK